MIDIRPSHPKTSFSSAQPEGRRPQQSKGVEGGAARERLLFDDRAPNGCHKPISMVAPPSSPLPTTFPLLRVQEY